MTTPAEDRLLGRAVWFVRSCAHVARAIHRSRIASIAGLFSMAAASGYGWGHGTSALALTPWVAFAWWRATTRLEAWLVVATYYAVASRALLLGAERFFGVSSWQARLVLACCVLVASAPWPLSWCPPTRVQAPHKALARVVCALLLSALPPLAAFTVMSPVAAAGVWFPKMHLGGLVALSALMAATRFGCGASSQHRTWLCVSTGFALTMVVMHQQPKLLDSPALEAVNTQFDVAHHESDAAELLAQWRASSEAIHRVGRARAALVALPEGAAGRWSASTQRVWSRLDSKLKFEHRAAVVGATLSGEAEADQAAAVVLGLAEPLVYRQRIPMPIAMWRPWAHEGERFAGRWAGPGTLRVRRTRIGILICWEIGAAWSVVGSVLQGADALVGLANTAWLRNTSAAPAQSQALASWSALFGLPAVLARNE